MEWLTIDDVANRYKVPRKTVYQWNHQGTGPDYIRVGRHVRYSTTALEEFEQRNRA